MKSSEKGFSPAKILLFGEYSVLYGGDSFLVPFNGLHGYFSMSDPTKMDSWSNNQLFLLNEYFHSNFREFDVLDLERFSEDVKSGLNFVSNIQAGSGLGSSAALCSAIAREYLYKKRVADLNELRNIFVNMESFFHGQSSGLDPLPSYTRQAVYVTSQEISTVENYETLPGETGAYLYTYSSRPVSTKEQVRIFRQKLAGDKIYSSFFYNEYMPLITEAILLLTEGNGDKFKNLLQRISRAQLMLFDWLIPPEFKTLFSRVDSPLYPKICGSGGNNFIIFSEETPARYTKMIDEKRLLKIF